MAKKIIIADDIDGSPDARSHSFALNAEQFEIDLSDENFKKLQEALAPYMEAGAKVTNKLPRASTAAGKSSSNKEELQKIRAWAQEQGLNVSPRGRISGEVVEKYQAAH